MVSKERCEIDEQKNADHKVAMEAIAQPRGKPTKFEPSPMHFPAVPRVPENEHAKKLVVEVVNTKIETPPFTLGVMNETKKIKVPILQASEPISKPVPSKPVITVPKIQPSPESFKPVPAKPVITVPKIQPSSESLKPVPIPAKPVLSGRWDMSQPGYHIGAPRVPTPEELRQFEIDSIKGEIESARRYVETVRVNGEKKIGKLQKKLPKLEAAYRRKDQLPRKAGRDGSVSQCAPLG